MASDYSIYVFYNGEKTNPFDPESQNTMHQFWEYEQLFEDKFNEEDFAEIKWIPTNIEDYIEWKAVLDKKPVDKAQLFKLWLFNLLMTRLPEKYLSSKDKFLRLYFDTHKQNTLASMTGIELFEYYTSEFTDYRQTLFQAHLQIGDKLFDMLEECEKTGKKIAVKETPQGVIDPPVHVFMK